MIVVFSLLKNIKKGYRDIFKKELSLISFCFPSYRTITLTKESSSDYMIPMSPLQIILSALKNFGKFRMEKPVQEARF